MVDLSEKPVSELRSAFEFFDTNNDGYITADELHSVLSQLGKDCSTDKCKDIIASACDSDRSAISFKEFCKLVAHVFEGGVEDKHIKGAFTTYDQDGDGLISKEDFRATVRALDRNVTDARLEEMFTAIDVNNDGMIDYEEFKNYWEE